MGSVMNCMVSKVDKTMDKAEKRERGRQNNDIIGSACQDYVNQNGGTINMGGRTYTNDGFGGGGFNSGFGSGFGSKW